MKRWVPEQMERTGATALAAAAEGCSSIRAWCLHLDVGREKSVKALEQGMVDDNMILLCSQSEVKHRRTDPGRYLPSRHHCQSEADAQAAERHDPRAGGRLDARRDRRSMCRTTNSTKSSCGNCRSGDATDPEIDALMRTVLSQFEHYINLSKKVTPETLAAVATSTSRAGWRTSSPAICR